MNNKNNFERQTSQLQSPSLQALGVTTEDDINALVPYFVDFVREGEEKGTTDACSEIQEYSDSLSGRSVSRAEEEEEVSENGTKRSETSAQLPPETPSSRAPQKTVLIDPNSVLK